MNFFIFLLVYFLIRGGTPKDQRRSDVSKGLFGLLFAIFILSKILPILTGLGGVALFGFGIYWLVRKLQQKQRQEENRRQQEYNDLHGYQEPSEAHSHNNFGVPVQKLQTVMGQCSTGPYRGKAYCACYWKVPG